MPTNSRVFLKPFIGGLNTEGSDTDDMVLNTSDELNCTILPEQMRGRRYGFNIEPDGRWIDANEDIKAHCVYHWNNVYDDNNFIVVQINRNIYIFKDVYTISNEDPIKIFDISSFSTMSDILPVDITSVSDSLFIVGKWLKPIVIKYNSETKDFEGPVLNNPKFRDFNGVDDGLKIDQRPTSLSFAHLYNLYNQGWDKEIYDPVGQTYSKLVSSDPNNPGIFYTTVVPHSYPANNMQWFIGKERSGEFNTTDLLNSYFGNTPAPKGHYIIDYINRSRAYAAGFNISDRVVTDLTWYKYVWYNTPQGGFWWNLYYYRNQRNWPQYNPWGNLGVWARDYYYSVEVPSNYSTDTIVRAVSVTIQDYNSVSAKGDGNFILFYNFKRSDRDDYIFSIPFDLILYGYDADNVAHEIGRTTCTMPLGHYTNTQEQFTISTTNTVAYNRYSVGFAWPNAPTNQRFFVPLWTNIGVAITATGVDEHAALVDGLPSSDLLKGAITDVENFGGRIFYLCGNTVLFSQTLSTDNKNYDKCYQEADPTSEEVSDVVATDGGMIQMLSLGRGKALKSFYRGVLVFGDKEVSGILSNSINLFSAESYDVVKITTAGLSGRYSVVETDNNIFYWSQHGVYMIGIDENNNISSQCISLNSIQNWYMNLNQECKDNVVGYYDYANNRIYWFYPTTMETEKLDGCLVYDLTFNSFMPQEIDCGNIVRDIYGEYVGRIDGYQNIITYTDGKTEDVYIYNNTIYTKDLNNIIGYTQNCFITDCCESTSVKYITPSYQLRAGGQTVVAGGDRVGVGITKDSVYDRKSAGVILISDGERFSFGDFNDREFHDWDVSPFRSYMVSRPITLGDTYFNKQTPVMQTLFKRTEEYKLRPFELDMQSGRIKHDTIRIYKDSYGHFNSGVITLPNGSYIKHAEISIDPHWVRQGIIDPTDPDQRFIIEITDADVVDWHCGGWITNGGRQTFHKNAPAQSYTSFYQGAINYFQITFGDWLVELRELPTPSFFPGEFESDAKPEYIDVTYTIIYSYSETSQYVVGSDYTTPSGAIIRMRWGWSVDPLSNRWDMMQNGYRPQKDFMHDDYVESRMHIRGRGKAFQVEIRNDSNKDFRLTGLNIITRSPQ